MGETRIYLDSQGGQPPTPQLLELAESILGITWNDGKSRHHESVLSQTAMETAIQTIANCLGVRAEQVLPVHRLGNSINLLASLYPNSAISQTSRKGALESFTGQKLSVDGLGRVVEFPKTESFFAPAANQETGVLEDIEKIKNLTGGIAIADATEWIGRKHELPAGDILIARAASWGGPTSVCFIIFRTQEISLNPRQILSLSPSNFDLLHAAAAMDMLTDVRKSEVQFHEWAGKIKNALEKFENITIHGDENSLPHLISFGIDQIDSETAAIAFDKQGIAVGSGSACSVVQSQTSHVLQAMGISGAGNVRLSLPISFSESDLEFFIERLPRVMQELSQAL